MSTENPYQSPRESLVAEISDDRASELVALRQSCLHREITIRAWGYAKLAIGALLIAWLFTYELPSLRNATTQSWTAFFNGLLGIVVGQFVTGIGFVRIQTWSRWWQLGLNAYFVVVASVSMVPGNDGHIFASMLLLALNASLLYLMASTTTRLVMSPDYRQACSVTTVNRLSRVPQYKLMGFTIVELLQMGTLFSMGLKTTGWIGIS
ncbi:MAG: hypothetical protein KF708_13565 [Pirellulales bacterium]|nr:hypothetical protein [Pirellulales bacterium]